MDALDGNAIAGTLFNIFGAEMTTATATCANCGNNGPLAELTIYPQAPGTVGRCRHCDAVLMVLVEMRGLTCVDVSGMAALEH